MCAAVNNLNKTEFVVKYFYALLLWVFQSTREIVCTNRLGFKLSLVLYLSGSYLILCFDRLRYNFGNSVGKMNRFV